MHSAYEKYGLATTGCEVVYVRYSFRTSVRGKIKLVLGDGGCGQSFFS